MGTANTVQADFQWHNDDGDEANSTTIKGAHINLDNNPTMDVPIRVRFLLQSTGDKDESDGYRLEYSVNGGTYTEVTTSSSYVRYIGSANTTWTLTDEDPTTQRLGGGTFDEGYWNDQGDTTSFTLAQGQESELEFCIQFRSADIGAGTITLQVNFDGGGALDGYTYTPSTIFTLGLTQPHFRIRSDDTLGLNVNSGWAGDLDANVSIAKGVTFRARFEIECGGNLTDSFKIQYNWSGDPGWNDCLYNTLEDGSTPILCTWSSQYADGAATTDILSGSSKSFTAGDGVEDAISTGSISLINEHTEAEFCLMIMNFFGTEATGIFRVDPSDTIQLRLVRSDDSIFEAYTSPTITVTTNNGYIGGTYAENLVKNGPFCDSNGNLYYIMEGYADSYSDFGMLKSGDGGDTWTEMDGVNRPPNGDLEALDAVYVAADKKIYIVHDGTTAGWGEMFHVFCTSDHGSTPDEWELTDQKIIASQAKTDHSMSVVRRSDDTTIALWRGTDGSSYERIYYNIRSSGGTWGSPALLDDTVTTHFSAVRAVLDDQDVTHIFYKDASNDDIYYNTISASDVLGSRQSCYTDAQSGGTDYQDAMTEAIFWLDGSDRNVMVAVLDDSDSYLYTVTVTNSGTPDSPRQATTNTVRNNPGATGSEQPVATLAINAATKTAYLIYADVSTADLYVTASVNDGTWTTNTEIVDGVSADWVSGLCFTHSAGNGGATVFGFTYDDGSDGYSGYVWYGEYALTAVIDVPLDALMVTSLWKALTVTPGAASVGLDLLASQASALALTVSPGEASIALNALATQLSVLVSTVTGGAVSTDLNLLSVLSETLSLTVSPGEASTALDLLAMQMSTQTISVSITTQVLLNLLSLISETKVLSVAGGPVSAGLNLQTLQAMVQTISVAMGAVSTPLNLLQMAVGTQALTVYGTVSIALGLLNMQSVALSGSASGGPVSVQASLLVLQSLAQTLSLTLGGVSVNLNLLMPMADVLASSLVPGAASIGLNLLAVRAAVQTITVGIVAEIALNLLSMMANTQSLSVSTGAVSIPLNALTAQIAALTTSVATGEATVSLNLLNMVSAALASSISTGAVSIPLDMLATVINTRTISVSLVGEILLSLLSLSAAAQSLSVVTGGVSMPMDLLSLASVIQALTVIPGGASTALNLLSVLSPNLGLSVLPGTVSMPMGLLNLSTLIGQSSIVPGAIQMPMGLLSLLGSAEALSVVPGAISMPMDILQLGTEAKALSVDAIVLIALSILAAGSSAKQLSVLPGAVTVGLNNLGLSNAILALVVTAIRPIKLDVDVIDALANRLGVSDSPANLLSLSTALAEPLGLDDDTR